ncbi:MAG: TldD/PmbA family protein [Candidatus ainarchaeum sp.]|nr:TldD/PmbA family protein [Candidatus ainarchaeum sp.]
MDLDFITKKLKDCDYYRINYEDTNLNFINARNSEVKQIKQEEYKGVSLFLVNKGKASFVSTNDLSKNNLTNLIERAKTLTKNGEKIDYLDLIDSKKVKAKVDIGKESKLDFETKVKEVLKNSSKENCNVNDIIYKETLKHKRILTNTKDISQNHNYFVLASTITVSEKDKIREGYQRYGKQTNIDDQITNLSSFVEKTKKEAIESLKYKSMLKGTYDVITHPELSHLLAHEAIGHACEADLVYIKESSLKLGKKLANSDFNVYDDPFVKDDWGYLVYDDEGNKAKKRTLIKSGIVNEFINDLKHSKKLNLIPNGGARAESYNKIPIPRMTNTGVGPGKIKKQELLEDLKKGIILCQGHGGQVDPASGTFQFGVRKAILIDKGKEENYVNLSFSGNITTDLFNIKGISKEVESGPEFIGVCGKSGQQAQVSGFGPYIKFSGVRF